MQKNSLFDPKERKEEDQTIRQNIEEDGVYLVNDDGTPFDDSERTYVSVDLPEREEKDDENG